LKKKERGNRDDRNERNTVEKKEGGQKGREEQ
jgi:hypothetical protein